MKELLKKALSPEWYQALEEEINKGYIPKILKEIDQIRKEKSVYPLNKDIFNAYRLTPFNRVKVVIIGNEPYPSHGASHGLAFSTLHPKTPDTLQNIFLEIKEELYPNGNYYKLFPTNNLTHWANQGVFLLNSILTVEANDSLSHQGIGWQGFTEKALIKLAQENRRIVYMLWGREARRFADMIDGINMLCSTEQLILESTSPHPASLNKGFKGNNHFIQCNEFLIKHKLKPIDWTTKEV